jgi:hypothetical protein
MTTQNAYKAQPKGVQPSGEARTASSSSHPLQELAPPTKDELLAQMAKGEAANGWDIVSSYSVDALNKVLAAAYTAGALQAEVSFSTQRQDPITGSNFTLQYQLTLGSPTIAFVAGQSGSALLTMPLLKGSYIITPEGGPAKSGDLPAGYNIIASVPLAAITGDGQVATSGNVITFKPGGAATASIVLHFKTSAGTGTQFSISPVPEPKVHDLLDTYLLPVMQQYFAEQVNELDYTLTGVAAHLGRDVVIVPKSFVFASDVGILSLYILSVNSGGAEGNPRPSFQPGGDEILPVPQGYTASIVLSRDFIKKVYLEPALNKLGRVEYDETQPGGITIKFYKNQAPLDYNPSHLGHYQLHIDTLTVDWGNLPFFIRFFNNTVTVSWSFSQSLHWSTDSIDPGTGDDIREDGTTGVNINLPAVSSTLSGSSDADITLSFAIDPSQYQISTQGTTSWLSSGPGIADVLTNYLQGAAATSLTFNFGGLNYFTVANLLFPAGHKFTIDSAVGLNVPEDLILFGDIS